MHATYTLPELGCDYAALEPVYSADLLETHYDVHHRACVDGANETLARLNAARERRDHGQISQLARDLAFNLSGHFLHSIFWNNLQPQSGFERGGDLERQLMLDFGGIDAFREEFAAAALGIEGSGWAVLCWEPLARQLIVQQVLDHHTSIASAVVPLLVVDMWEHAYYLQYRAMRRTWVRAFWTLINWQDVERRLAAIRGVEALVLP